MGKGQTKYEVLQAQTTPCFLYFTDIKPSFSFKKNATIQ